MTYKKLALGTAVSIALMTGLTACGAASDSTGGDTSAHAQSADIYSRQSITDVSNGVADWQLGHMELEQYAPFVPSFQDRSEEKRGWIQGAFFKGLVDYAARTDNDAYFEFLKNFAAEQGYKLEDRLYHADDHVVGQYYMALYDRYKDPIMIKHTQDTFDEIIANPSDVSLDFGRSQPIISTTRKKACSCVTAAFLKSVKRTARKSIGAVVMAGSLQVLPM